MRVILCAALAVLSATAYAKAPSPEHQKLAAFLGSWITEGKVEASPFGPACTYKGTLKGEWYPGGFAVVRHDEQKFEPGGTQRSMLVFYYDAGDKSHQLFITSSDGNTVTMKLTFGKNSNLEKREIDEAENRIEDALRQGLSVKEAREKYRYHSLQTRK